MLEVRTSTPNLDSKPIIDVDIIYENESEFEKIKSGLIKIGYYHNGNQGIEKREVFKRNGKSFYGILNMITHHLYVCLKNSEPLDCTSTHFFFINLTLSVIIQNLHH
tara:strand:- start:519 stop:839 length:321 start_codon:yes stop_codon:yes gene_type:complete